MRMVSGGFIRRRKANRERALNNNDIGIDESLDERLCGHL